jgi:hypothetical protein
MRRRVGLVLAVGVLVAVSVPALAGDKGKHKSGKDEKSSGPTVAVTAGFSSEQRGAVEAYFVEKHGRGGCPPGLAKKHNGCLPPGQAKKQYAVGRALSKGVETHPPSAEIRARIGNPPEGYLYVMVDGDLLKLAAGTMLVVDAIDGLVH